MSGNKAVPFEIIFFSLIVYQNNFWLHTIITKLLNEVKISILTIIVANELIVSFGYNETNKFLIVNFVT